MHCIMIKKTDYINRIQIEEGIKTRKKWLREKNKKLGKAGSTGEFVKHYNKSVPKENINGIAIHPQPLKRKRPIYF